MSGYRHNQMRSPYGSGSIDRNRKMQSSTSGSRYGSGSSISGGSGYSNPVNPWLTGAAASGLGSSSVLDQAQLALASNLLSTILGGGQAHSQSVAPPPSLFNMNRSNIQPSGYGGMSNLSTMSSSMGRDRFQFVPRSGPQLQQNYGKRDVRGNKRFGGGDQGRNKIRPRKSYDQNKRGNPTTDTVQKKAEDDKKKDSEDDRNKNRSDESKDKNAVSEKTKSNSDKEQSAKKSTDDDDKSFEGIIPCLFYCHVCRKHMWDDISFLKHLDGRPHNMMIEELDQKYKMMVEIMRHESRAMEKQRELDIQRAFRKGKTNIKTQQRGFCTMCNLNFNGTLPAHRRNERHQRLKKFLHPKCNMCDVEFFNRLEWDDHKLTPGHLRKLQEVRQAKRPHLGICEFDVVDFIEDVNDNVIATCSIDIQVDGERKTFSDEEKEEIDKSKEEIETLIKSDDKKDGKFPAYTSGLIFGEEFVDNIQGYLCRACYRFMPSEEDYKAHCQTLAHYNNAINVLKIMDKLGSKPTEESTKVEESMDTSARQETSEAEDDGDDEATDEDNGEQHEDDGEQNEDDGEQNEDENEPSPKRHKVEVDDYDVVEDYADITSMDTDATSKSAKDSNLETSAETKSENEKVEEDEEKCDDKLDVEVTKKSSPTKVAVRGARGVRGGRARRSKRY